MEVKPYFLKFVLIASLLGGCTNFPEVTTTEIQTIDLLREALKTKNIQKMPLNTREILSRKEIDDLRIPMLFVELPSGKNGTLTQYPGKGIGVNWLSADGATISLDQGIILATRGMGDDVMGSKSSFPGWNSLNQTRKYARSISYLSDDNKIKTRFFSCILRKSPKTEKIKIYDLDFETYKFNEACEDKIGFIENIFYLDKKGVVRRSRQFHSTTIGYLLIERLDR